MAQVTNPSYTQLLRQNESCKDDQNNDTYKKTIALSLGYSWLLFAVVFGLLFHWNIFQDATFFKVDINDEENRPEVLEVPIADSFKHWFFILFFFSNSFLSEWNGVVIASIFGKMEVGTDGGGVYSRKGDRYKLFLLFLLYDCKPDDTLPLSSSATPTVPGIRFLLFSTNCKYTASLSKKRFPKMSGPVNMTR
jgi:hypothetical protein